MVVYLLKKAKNEATNCLLKSYNINQHLVSKNIINIKVYHT